MGRVPGGAFWPFGLVMVGVGGAWIALVLYWQADFMKAALNSGPSGSSLLSWGGADLMGALAGQVRYRTVQVANKVATCGAIVHLFS
jgi:hypothetical protein